MDEWACITHSEQLPPPLTTIVVATECILNLLGNRGRSILPNFFESIMQAPMSLHTIATDRGRYIEADEAKADRAVVQPQTQSRHLHITSRIFTNAKLVLVFFFQITQQLAPGTIDYALG